MRKINNPIVVVYKQVSPFRNANGRIETKYVGEIDKRDGMPGKVYGATPEQLGKLLSSNIKSMGIQSYDFSTNPKEGHARLRDSIAPGTEVRMLDKEEAAKVQAAVTGE